ncbi:MAG: hypothetical protein II969_18050 [Anaerolineaceae bacterium]|nr:hypothetical protein [Anaerolineaceae bacterium]
MSNNTNRINLIGIVSAVLAAVSASIIYYCEKLQLMPLTPIGLAGRLALSALLGGTVFYCLFLAARNQIRTLKAKEWLPILLTALTLSICVLIWFPIPNTGLFGEHILSIHAIPNENGEINPVSLTWFHRENGDIPLSAVHCTGNCIYDENNPTLTGQGDELNWTGKTGNLITLEFKSGKEQGIAEISWDGISTTVSLNNEAFSRLSYDFALSLSNGLPELIAVWLLSFFLCFAGTLFSIKLLPKWNFGLFFGIAFTLFAAFRIIQFCTVTAPLTFIDSDFYIGQSRLPLMDLLRGEKYCRIPEWHCLSRPLLIPLVYKACRQNYQTITIVQLIVSLISWGYFARKTALLCARDISQKLIVIFCFGLGCIPNVTRWDQMIMSESLSISTGMLLMGSLFWLTAGNKNDQWQCQPALCTALSAFLFAHSRDSALWTVIAVIVMLLLLTGKRDRKRVIFLLTALLSLFSFLIIRGTGDRWVYSFENVLFNRIAKDPQGLNFLIREGMPTPEHIEQFYGTEHVMADPLFNSEEFKPLRDWILSDGLKTYFRYLLLTPAKALRMTWYYGFEAEAFEKIDYTFTPFEFQNLLPDPLIKFFSANLPGAFIICIAIAAAFTAFRVPDGERYAFPLLLILTAYPLSTAANLADEYELDRHIITILIMMKASIWPLLIMLLEDRKTVK